MDTRASLFASAPTHSHARSAPVQRGGQRARSHERSACIQQGGQVDNGSKVHDSSCASEYVIG
eukprot:10829432-Alexandrium_andersonii.AAC.1